MTTHPTNEATIQQWNSVLREAMEPDGDFAKRLLINPVPLRMLGDVRGLRVLDAGCGQGYLNELAALGCRLQEISEPGLAPDTAREAAGVEPGIESYVHLPNFLIVAAGRP